jgi:hypothetical protein
MQRKLLGIINVDFKAKDQLVITYSAFIKYLRKNGNKIRLFTDFKKACDSVRKEVFYDTLSFVSP